MSTTKKRTKSNSTPPAAKSGGADRHHPYSTGPAALLGRLEQDARELRKRVSAAADRGDAVAEKTLRRQLLLTEDQARRIYTSLPVRADGEVVSREVVESLLEFSGYCLNAALRSSLTARVVHLVGATTPAQVLFHLNEAREDAVPAALMALTGLTHRQQPVPEWMLRALANHWAGKTGDRFEWIEAHRQAAHALLAEALALLEKPKTEPAP